ncbi:MAG: malonyl-CoA decarboxylase domain-containing protein, partial [Alphaproteobacteria bacterium]
LRAELMSLGENDPGLAALEADLKGLLASWFDVGFLEMRRITWDSSATLLEKLIAYEAVHEIRSWHDLKNRLASDRRCFAFFHPAMPDEPLIFLEAALVNGLSDNIQTLLDETAPIQDPRTADTAIFYSISNAQRGLAGINFGGFLIKRVIDHLSAEFKGLKTFATLSPIPGFRAWLDARIDGKDPDLLTALLTVAERKALAGLPQPVADEAAFKTLLAATPWNRDKAVAEALKGSLMRLCAGYLLERKIPDHSALDPVGHFHFSNGARVERLNWLGDTSPKGLQQSTGIMSNYLYRLGDIEANHEAYTGEGKIAASPAIKKLAKG